MATADRSRDFEAAAALHQPPTDAEEREPLLTRLRALFFDGTPQAFLLDRREDVTGVSGTGPVAEGVRFSDGTVALRWTSDWPTSVVFHDRGVESVEAVHGHDGRTKIVWLSPTAEELRDLAALHPPREGAEGDQATEMLLSELDAVGDERNKAEAALAESRGENETLKNERLRMLALLWEIRMTAERASVDEPVFVLPNAVIHLAETAMGMDRQLAQELANRREAPHEST